jgi:hypothetical protein
VRANVIKKASVDELVVEYRRAATAQWAAIAGGQRKAAYANSDIVAKVYTELRARGRDAQMALLPLLEDLEPGVRAWAAAHALEFAPDRGEPVLRALEQNPKGLTAVTAKYALKQWREGTLRFP